MKKAAFLLFAVLAVACAPDPAATGTFSLVCPQPQSWSPASAGRFTFSRGTNVCYPAGNDIMQRNAGPKILEPIYNVDILTPNEFVGPCMSDLNGRRGMIMNQDMDKGFTILHARVPLAELYRYSTTLSSLTGGAATFTMKFAEYQQVPADVQTKLLAEYAAQEQDED